MAKDKKKQYEPKVKFTFTDGTEVTYIFKNVQNLLEKKRGHEFVTEMGDIFDDISRKYGKTKRDIKAINDNVVSSFNAADDFVIDAWLIRAFNKSISIEKHTSPLLFQSDALHASEYVKDCISYEEVEEVGVIGELQAKL